MGGKNANIIVPIILSGLVVIAAAIYVIFILPSVPKPTRIFDPTISAKAKAEIDATNRAYADFQAKFPPAALDKLQADLYKAHEKLQAEQTPP